MAIKKLKPVTPGSRHGKIMRFDEITAKKPEKSLTKALRKTGGRNNYGRKTVSSKGGGHRRRYRIIDFKYAHKNQEGIIQSIEYDPNRSANIALVLYDNGQKAYMISPVGLKVGEKCQSGEKAKIKIGNSMPLKNIPTGSMVYCVELELGRGAKVARSAGNGAIIDAKDGNNIHLRLPSGEVRLVNGNCYASIGQVGNVEHENISLGKAGRSRYLGRRPKSRAVAKNPVDHPMGGGEGKSSGGRHPTTPWGKITKGLKTRKKKKASNKKIIKRRK